MPHSLALIHTVVGLVPTFEDLVRRHLPGWAPFNIVDESLLRNVIRQSEAKSSTMRRLANHVWSAVDAGAEAILVTCSSIGPAVDATRPFCPVPLVRVDEGMADAALDAGNRIGVLATLSSTLEPTRDLLNSHAARAGRSLTIVASICEGAFASLAAGDRAGHDARVAEGIAALADQVDVIVLAQASMARVVDGELGSKIHIPVLSSPELGVLHLRSQLAEQH